MTRAARTQFANGAIAGPFAAAVGEAAANSNGITAARGSNGIVGARADIENPEAAFDSREAAAYDVTSKANALPPTKTQPINAPTQLDAQFPKQPRLIVLP